MMDLLPIPPVPRAALVEPPALVVGGDVVENPHVGTIRDYTIYRARQDRTSRPFYVVARGPRMVALGERDLFLRPLEDLRFLQEPLPGHFELPALQQIAKEQGLQTHRQKDDEKKALTEGELVEDLENLHKEDLNKLLFFEEIPPYDLDVLLGLGENLPDVLDKARRGGWQVDEDLDFSFKAHLVPVDPARVPPRLAMRTAPNEIDVTGTKAGKSSIASRLGRVVERPTPAGLLGFADSEKRVHGVLYGATRTVFVDEIAQEPKEEAARAISTYLEVGEVEISRGIGLKVRGWAPVVFLANPPPGTDTFASALESFLAVERAMTSTQAEALGSRQALLLFKPKTRPAGAEGALEGVDLAKAEALITSFQAHMAPLFSEALQEEHVSRWLARGFPEEHVNRILRAADRVAYPEVAAFLRGYAEGHRHARGLALRAAVVDTAPRHLEAGEIQVQALLKRADDVFRRLVALREESLQELAQVAGDEDLRRERLRSLYTALPYEYAKKALGAIAYWAQDEGEGLAEVPVPLEAVRESFLASPLYERQGYWRFPRLQKTLDRNLNTATELAVPFGLRFSSGQYGVEFRVSDSVLFKEARVEIRGVIAALSETTPGGQTAARAAQARARHENLRLSKGHDSRDSRGPRRSPPQTSAGFDPDLGVKQGSAAVAEVAEVPPEGQILPARIREVLRREKGPVAAAFLASQVHEDQAKVEKWLEHLRENGQVQERDGGWRWIGR